MKIAGDWLTRPGTQAVCAALTDAGHQALFVGGCVRNALLGVPVADIDIATDAVPETVIDACRKRRVSSVVPTGIEHGTVTVVAGGIPHEVTTFRRDVETVGRHAVVAFSTDDRRDAARRDFTMNALYATPDGQVIDPLGGLPDLLARRVRFVGDAAGADRRGLPAHPALLPLSRLVWRPGRRAGCRGPGRLCCACRRHRRRCRANGSAPRCASCWRAATRRPSVAAMAQAGVLARVLPGRRRRARWPLLVHLEAGRTPALAAPPCRAGRGGRGPTGCASAGPRRARLATLARRHRRRCSRRRSWASAMVRTWRPTSLLARAALSGNAAARGLAEASCARRRGPVSGQRRRPDAAPAAARAWRAALKALEARWIASGLRAGARRPAV